MPAVVLASTHVSSLASGYDLRVFNLCKALSNVDELTLITLPLTPDLPHARGDARINLADAFVRHLETPAPDTREKCVWRHIRWSEVNFFRLAYPRFYRMAVQMIRDAVEHNKASRLVVFGSGIAEFALPFIPMKVLFDVCDSKFLTLLRETNGPISRETRKPFGRLVSKYRWKNLERNLPAWFTKVTTINEADSECIRSLSKSPTKVETVPNGVGERFFHAAEPNESELRRGLVFWGNLSFGPNLDAITYFIQNIYLPHLQEQDVELCIIGGGANRGLLGLSAACRNICFTGYVQDIVPLVIRYPVMINPMVTGSGLKNKVLEAFAMRRTVISTSLGMEAITDAVDGIHYVGADTPASIASAVLSLLADRGRCDAIGAAARDLVLEHYSWAVIGKIWRNVYSTM